MEKFLLDENIPPAIGDFLRKKGFDVEDVWGLGKSGATDEDLIAIASEKERILVSFDKHFADIISYPPGNHHGIIRIRIHPPLIAHILEAFEKLLIGFDLKAVKGSLVVLEKKGYRIRRGS